MTEPNKELLSDERIPTATLAGQKWPVPKMAIRQCEVVVPLIVKRMADVAGGPAGLTAEVIHDLATVVFWGLERGHKGLTREEFDEMPIDLTDLIDAMLVVSRQTGLLKPGKLEVNGTSPLGQTVPLASSPTG
jgi:hypothetical protein